MKSSQFQIKHLQSLFHDKLQSRIKDTESKVLKASTGPGPGPRVFESSTAIKTALKVALNGLLYDQF